MKGRAGRGGSRNRNTKAEGGEESAMEPMKTSRTNRGVFDWDWVEPNSWGNEREERERKREQETGSDRKRAWGGESK